VCWCGGGARSGRSQTTTARATKATNNYEGRVTEIKKRSRSNKGGLQKSFDDERNRRTREIGGSVRYEVDASLGVAFLRTMNKRSETKRNERTNEARRRYLARSGSRSRDPEIDLPRPSVERQARGASGRAAFDGTQVIASAKCSRSELSRGLVGALHWRTRLAGTRASQRSCTYLLGRAGERASRRERAARTRNGGRVPRRQGEMAWHRRHGSGGRGL